MPVIMRFQSPITSMVYMGASQNQGYLYRGIKRLYRGIWGLGFGGFPKLGVSPKIRIMVSWGLYWGARILDNYHVGNPA